MEQPAFNIFEALSAWGKTLLTVEVLVSELDQFNSIKLDYSKARKEWAKAKPTATNVFS